jgi:hypothetical protein
LFGHWHNVTDKECSPIGVALETLGERIKIIKSFTCSTPGGALSKKCCDNFRHLIEIFELILVGILTREIVRDCFEI